MSILTFLKMGLRDNVTITLFSLSTSDLCYLVIRSVPTVGRFIISNHPNHPWPFHPHILTLGTFWYSFVFYDFSAFVSVFLAVVRCACVAKPLLFKSMFTKARTLSILGSLFLLALVLRIPVLTVFRLTWIANPRTNATFRTVEYTENFMEIYKANDIANRNILSWLTYITMVVCVVILASKLRAASRLRHTLTAQTVHEDIRDTEISDMQAVPRSITNSTSSSLPPTISETNNKTPHNSKDLNKISSKDLQVIQSVTLICFIFIFSQLPYQAVSTVRLLDPEFNDVGSRVLLYGIMGHVSTTFSFINASINIVVLYNYNTKYREQFRALFCHASLK
ncbi:chemosensory receptor C [Elysia marginata]|uniref:Chemosensory receptor C n=1 Tax=Elysia marginata TaxID=1093978 RepID=A0AAV4FSJ1_9GAST|nr:chemosensory receptor C [Elysia marginata]